MKLALLGDLHGYFDSFDVEYFNQSDYDYLLFTGDLPGFLHFNTKIFRTLSQLEKPAFLIWGNHDGFSLCEVLGELFHISFMRIQTKDISTIEKKLNTIRKQLGGNFTAGGYRIHLLAEDFALFVVRPHTIGGKRLSYLPYMKDQYQIETLEDSFRKMKNMILYFLKSNPIRSMIFLGHNGPYGINPEPGDLWGCDFHPEAGDFGDPDFEHIIKYVQQQNIQVPLVVAGHMHHRLSKKAIQYLKKKNHIISIPRERQAITKIGNTYYVNPAKVPRIYKVNKKKIHYHISVNMTSNFLIEKIEEQWIEEE